MVDFTDDDDHFPLQLSDHVDDGEHEIQDVFDENVHAASPDCHPWLENGEDDRLNCLMQQNQIN